MVKHGGPEHRSGQSGGHDIDALQALLLARLEAYFGADTKRIDHAREVLEHALAITPAEGADARITMPAAILHDVGIKPSEEKYGVASGHLQEMEGPPVARGLLEGSGLAANEVEAVCSIVANHHTVGRMDSREFRVVYDADWVVNLREIAGRMSAEQVRRFIDVTMLTGAGKARAREVHVK